MMETHITAQREIKSLMKLTLPETRLINLFFLGFILYSFGFSLASSGLMNYILCNLIQLVGILLFLPSAILLVELRVENSYLRIIHYAYVLYLLFIIIRGFVFEYYALRDLAFDAWFGIFIYLSPIVNLFPKKIEFLIKLNTTIKIFSIIFVILILGFLPQLIVRGGEGAQVLTEVLPRTLGITAGFLLFTYPYQSLKTNLTSLCILLSILLIAIYQARRGLMIYCVLILFLSTLIYLKHGKNRTLLVVATLMIFSSILIVGAEILNESSFFSSIVERGVEDTRTRVELDYYEDMEYTDWIIGRGINGQYYSPGIMWDGEASVYRGIIETDFLQIILKGGIVSLTLLFLIMIPASVLGIFFSNNLLAKAFGLWIFIGLINMYPSSVNTFTLNYLIMWVGVGVCFTKEFRNHTDAKLIKYFKNN